jgi:hypothetical protein
MRKTISVIALAALIAAASVQASYAQGGGGGGGSAGGGSAGGASSGSAVGSPSAGSAGAGSLGVNGMPRGPANAAGPTNSGNDPSGVGNAPNFNQGTTTRLANPSANSPQQNQRNGDQGNSTNSRGTSSAGTAQGGGGTLRSNGTRMPGPNTATTTKEGDSDAKIDAENRRFDRMVKGICKGC